MVIGSPGWLTGSVGWMLSKGALLQWILPRTFKHSLEGQAEGIFNGYLFSSLHSYSNMISDCNTFSVYIKAED